MLSETNIIELLEFLIDNIIVMFGGRGFQLTIGILSLGANCAPLLADLFRFSYEEDFIHGLLKKKLKKLTRSFDFSFHKVIPRLVIMLIAAFPSNLMLK